MDLNFIIANVFLPPKLPQSPNDVGELGLGGLVHQCTEVYQNSLPDQQKKRWGVITKMLANLNQQEYDTPSKIHIEQSVAEMQRGDVVVFFLRAQNAGVVLRKISDKTVFEFFEVSPPINTVMGASGKLICTYPGPAVSVPEKVVNNLNFRDELASFLGQMGTEVTKTTPLASKAADAVDSPHPRYITQLLAGILRGIGQVADVHRVQKRIADDVLGGNDSRRSWRRSAFWLVIRVVLQTTLYQESNGNADYKSFMVFFMATVLKQALKPEISSDLIFCMRAKLSRRAYKLGAALPDFVFQMMDEAVQAAELVLRERWLTVQKNSTLSVVWAPETFDIPRDTQLSLMNSKTYLARILDGKLLRSWKSAFAPQHSPRRFSFAAFCEVSSGRVFSAGSVALADFERAVREDIDNWTEDNLSSNSACGILSSYIVQYHDSAIRSYKPNPESMSLMYLTLFELWVSLDKIATAQCPLLREYSPEVPAELLETLLLRKSESITRLTYIEGYIRKRRSDADKGSTFTDDVGANSFGARYVDTSAEHQALLSRIETAASLERRDKIEELSAQNKHHKYLVDKSRSLAHEFRKNCLGKIHHIRKKCHRCVLEKQASRLKIGVHEWPLPRDPYQAKSVVFELKCPLVISLWRTTTFQLLYDFCTPHNEESEASRGLSLPVLLNELYDFCTYTKPESLPRITLASTKSSTPAFATIPCVESSVCIDTQMHFKLFDGRTRMWAARPFTKCNVSVLCTLKLPKSGPYRSLQYAVDSTTHTSNQIIAAQSECPKELNLHEYIAFAGLRSGQRLQWLNIARELPVRSLTFLREEVHTLLTQAAWQAGHLSETNQREWHIDLESREFGIVLVQEMEHFLSAIEGSWLEAVSARTIIALACRLLASATDMTVVNQGYALLRKARGVTFNWLQQLSSKLVESHDDAKVREFQLRICEIAATCRATYDVDSNHLVHLLNSPSDISLLLECAVLIYDNTPPQLDKMSLDFRRLLDRDRRLAHYLEPILSQHIREDGEGLDHAVAAIWSAYRAGSAWKQEEAPNDRWFTVTSASDPGEQGQGVQFNILEGMLLINGKPLNRLPQTITSHATYTRIFGQKILSVIPADIPDMDFATRGLISGHQVYFSLQDNDRRLVIQAKRGDEVRELIPHSTFVGDLPSLLIDNYTHWFDISTSDIELRPVDSPWASSPRNWHIRCGADKRYRMSKDTSVSLIDIRSPTFQMIFAYLNPLESKNNLVVTSSPVGPAVTVDLPRFRLSFFLNEQKLLESSNMPGMVIDSDQSMGTMIGLRNQLVLRPTLTNGVQLYKPRRVLIPYGKPVFHSSDGHVTVTIDTNAVRSVRFFEYKIDTDLGCLVGNSSLASRLYKVYLHAISSYCLPDPLTGRTGTEEALSELGSAGCLSFQGLGAVEEDILRQINSLSPSRISHGSPIHMQVYWSNLPPIAQHHGFHTYTRSIVAYANRLQMFREKEAQVKKDVVPDRPVALFDRGTRRSALFFSEELKKPMPSGHGDVTHSSRDLARSEKDKEDESIASNISSMVYHWPSKLNTSRDLFDTLKKLQLYAGEDQGLKLCYSHDWLQLDIARSWFSLYDLCRGSSKDENHFHLIFTLSAMAYGSSSSIRALIPSLVAFATMSRFRNLNPPTFKLPFFDFSKGFEPQKEGLKKMILSSTVVERGTDARDEADRFFELSEITRVYRRGKLGRDAQASELADRLLEQWPCEEITWPPSEDFALINILEITAQVDALFRCCFQNREFRTHMMDVQAILDMAFAPDAKDSSKPNKAAPSQPTTTEPPTDVVVSSVHLAQLFKRAAPSIQPPSSPLETRSPVEYATQTNSVELEPLLLEFQQSQVNDFHRMYGKDLDESRRNLNSQKFPVTQKVIRYSLEELASYRHQCKLHLDAVLDSIRQSLSPLDRAEAAMLIAGLWPRLTIRSLLSMLSFSSATVLNSDWKAVLISLGQAVLLFQRSQRLLRFATLQNREEFFEELRNVGEGNRDAMGNPDWLLIQVEGDFLVRPLQVSFAQEMINPSDGQNTVMQLNMGEGKTSVIVPMVAAAIADGTKLARVVVLKSLATQMFQLLVQRLSGLANRRIFYMPFTRSAKLEPRQAEFILSLFEECKQVGGILIAQPEHILTFKLMGVDRVLSSKTSSDREVSGKLLETQKWLEKYSRDILDESDEILHVRYQLLYTVGQDQPLEDHPDRWTTVQQLFSLVWKHAPRLREKYPLGIQVIVGDPRRIPPRILQASAGDALITLIAEDVLAGALSNYSFEYFPERVRHLVLRMITEMGFPRQEIQVIKKYCQGTGLWKGLLLLRGMLAGGILVYALKDRRWRVDYGLDPKRTLLAVPYRAKDVPSQTAEFGHPDVSVTLTSLSYYHGGLTNAQVDLCFHILHKLDDPEGEYWIWTQNGKPVPEQLRQLSGVNTNDPQQREEHLFPLFRHNRAVIDFFLSQVVFPKEAKSFPEKLEASSWDIAEVKAQATTGFSGTNDNSYLLPTSIVQRDPLHQSSTTAKVLCYILLPENDHYICARSQSDESLDVKGFIELLVKQTPEISVLLDVGAQMLELQNAELAMFWLSLSPGAQAVVFFGDGDEPVVLTRDGNVEPFISSPFNQQLDKCLVYLDDAHTRGTDLKLPRDSRAAVTLGPRVTKDRLLQGCMRMRKLGHGQSVVFFAPPEIDQSIRDAAGKTSSDTMKSLDILRWAMQETCEEIQRHVSHWLQQGVDYESRNKAWQKDSSSRHPSVKTLKSSWLQKESRSLESMYGFPSVIPGLSLFATSHHAAFDIPALRERCTMLGQSSLLEVEGDLNMAEEQEREAIHEVEKEREVERPPKAEAAYHQVHDHVRHFVKTGEIILNSSEFVPVFYPLRNTAAEPPDRRAWASELLATKDFSVTIKDKSRSVGDYLRPVNWIISSTNFQGRVQLVVLSSYEVNELLSAIRASKHVHLHMYSPRVVRSMKSFDDLKFYCIPKLSPSWRSPTIELTLQLNLWAGQLYVPDFGTYLRLCEFLGIYCKTLWPSEDDVPIQQDGFVKKEHRRGTPIINCPFIDSPIPFLKELIGIRRKGTSYLTSHVGKIVRAKQLIATDFE